MNKFVFLDAATLGNDISLEALSRLGQLTCYPTTRPEQTAERIGNAEVAITNKVVIDNDIMEKCPNLKLICVAATGTNNIDLEAAAARGIGVRNVAGYSTESVAQTTLAMVLQLTQHVTEFDHFVHNGSYSRSGLFTFVDLPYRELCGKTWGIIGLGTIGKRVAQIAHVMGCQVQYYSTSGKNSDAQWARTDLDNLLKTSDIISIHAPLNASTTNLIDQNELTKMKHSAILINVGRGGIVNEEALATALDNGSLAAAGCDVFTTEPLPAEHPFLHMAHPEHLLLTPHIAWASHEARTKLVALMANNIETFFS